MLPTFMSWETNQIIKNVCFNMFQDWKSLFCLSQNKVILYFDKAFEDGPVPVRIKVIQ